MEKDTIVLKLMIPSGLMLEERVRSVTLPSAVGEIGIYSQHVQYTGLLGTGVLRYAALSGDEQQVVISGGFCTFSEEVLTVLADSADLRSEIDLKHFADGKAQLQQIVDAGNTFDPDWEAARHKLLRIEALERLVQH